MIKFIKEVFNSKALKKAVLLAGVVSEANAGSADYMNLIKYITRVEENTSSNESTVNKEMELKKAS
ncbi:hypothetical protein [Clostridium sp. BL-8]|uniref:hypothetical protein n=1 Tax=Clostridium sp. BL-8 TaxID=349938 RepID=UPI00098CD49D|nr:hypothetical protein [Clostridium sp. BL-8]OOM80909.1 hypothetical protein CLOBL_05080 [Clostridium sp. BL-8]